MTTEGSPSETPGIVKLLLPPRQSLADPGGLPLY